MKPFAIILVVLVLAAVIGVGWLYLNARMDIRFVACVANDGVDQAEVFDTLKARVKTPPSSAPFSQRRSPVPRISISS